ncbi:unnamed protein product [Staurois parvus]|uniref:Uncharacterized protein n=1 Tax=Staurois parvus TaxID=386267 RepID=A0ABN9B1U8_9NEOB|nr:unnamed protein product [Staurois parvus]
MRCPWYLFHRLFFEFGQGHRGPMIPYCPGGPMSCQSGPGSHFMKEPCQSLPLSFIGRIHS